VESRIRLAVDAAYIERATEELFAMLLHQENGFRERWYGSPGFQRLQKVLRGVGLGVTLLGLALCLWYVIEIRRSLFIEFSLALFIAFALIFFFVPQLLFKVRAWGARQSELRCRTRARKVFRPALKLAPFEAEYDLKGDLVVYSRCKNGEWNVAWHRKLSKFRTGVAMQSGRMTAIFRKPRSFLPAVVILHERPDQIGEVLSAAGIAIHVSA
jgi:hypothetical protein